MIQPFRTIFVLVIFLQIFNLDVFSQETMFVFGKEKGNGMLIERSGECFVLSPHHVVYDYTGEITLYNKDRIKSIGKLIQVFDPDIAIIRIEKGGTQNCLPWKVNDSFNMILNNSSAGFIEYRDGLGMANLLHVSIISKDQVSIAVVPKFDKDQFKKGMSGSAFYVNYKDKKVLIGMLMSIEEDLTTGYIYQYDDVLRSTKPFFEFEKKAKKNIGVLIMKDGNNFPKATNQFVLDLNDKGYKASGNLPQNDFIYSEFDNILLGKSNKTIPTEIKTSLDELLLGKIEFDISLNDYEMHVVRASFEGSVFSTNNFELIKTIYTDGKGINHNQSLAQKQAIKSLVNNFKQQFE